MATVYKTQSHRIRPSKKLRSIREQPFRWKDDGIDFELVRRESGQLLRLELNEYEFLLNRHLIEELEGEFAAWLASEEKAVQAQIRTVPKNARREWIQEKYGSFDAETNQETQRRRTPALDRRRRQNQTLRMFTDFMFGFVCELTKRIDSMKQGNIQFRNTFSHLRLKVEKHQAILRYAEELGASKARLREDRRALNRWFDEEAVTDRYAKKLGHTELILTFSLDRLGTAVNQIFSLADKFHRQELRVGAGELQKQLCSRARGIWERLQIERKLEPLLEYEGEPRVLAAALRFLSRAGRRLPYGSSDDLVDIKTRMKVHRYAMNSRADAWVQCEAMNVLAGLNFREALPLLFQRLEQHRTGDDIFVRRHVLFLLKRRVQAGFADLENLPIETWMQDPSVFVRQELSECLFEIGNVSIVGFESWQRLAMQDESQQVRAAALVAGQIQEVPRKSTQRYLQVLSQVLEKESNAFVLRTALHCTCQIVEKECVHNDPELVQQIDTHLLNAILQLTTRHDEVVVRRWAAHAYERIRAEIDPQLRGLLSRLRETVKDTGIGRSTNLPNDLATEFKATPERMGRLLAVMAQDDFGYDHNIGLFRQSLTRGPVFGFRLWRFLYEFRNTATDKRQALSHTVGRLSTATLRAPSQICGELSETKIPGEPLTLAEEGAWRPYLPLPDDFIAVLNRSWLHAGQSTSFFTSQGKTTVAPPKSIWKRLQATWSLTWRFNEHATRRNWNADSRPADDYIEKLRGLGFQVEFEAYPENDLNDESVSRFFDAKQHGVALPLLAALGQQFWWWVESFSDYFQSPWENSLEQLVLFAVCLCLWFVGKHFWANFRFRKARRQIPLSIGGWGTRGKSGTERLKAALIGVTGHGLVSKTTGCEAMFIHGDPHGEPLEVPLFRPYDKATIWEQHNLICMASRMKPAVFLWECMALTPSYVDVLQRQWTNDDLGTITNTYPDHEDLQGPAGHNVATTISGFVPTNSHLLTTEEVMRPYVKESCRDVSTSFRGVGWLESGLVADDILARFPYQEHPDNIALVAAMGDELGYGYEYCVKAMADYLVPDLGVLKTHPVSEVRSRKLEFTNGCSANERFGCMGNWKRLGYAEQDSWEEPTTWITGVVNNRADRVPRSKVFAKIIVDDIHADRFFLIGSNLKGLKGFIEEAWADKASMLTLVEAGEEWDVGYASSTLRKAAQEYRQPIEAVHIRKKLACVLSAVGLEVDDSRIANIWEDLDAVKNLLSDQGIAEGDTVSVLLHHQEWLAAKSEYEELASKIGSSTVKDQESLDSDFAKLLKTWFDRRIVTVDNYDASGEDVVAKVVDETPPGFLNRCMGLQNIKGTGLDFVYRFQAWDVCYDACEIALGRNSKVGKDNPAVSRALQALVAMPALGQLCEGSVQELLKHARSDLQFKSPELAALVEQLDQKFQNAKEANSQLNGSDQKVLEEGSSENPSNASTTSGNASELRKAIRDWTIEHSEQLLDVHDSVRRRKRADLIYQDLAEQRIGRQRAVSELRTINKRQKGGWLASKFTAK